jgi:uncharacterized protein (TIGR03000 family)
MEIAMNRCLAVLVGCFVIAAPMRAQEIVFPDGLTPSQMNGLIIIRKGNQTTTSLGGGLLPQWIRVKTETPEGPVVTKFRLPSALHMPYRPPLPQAAPAMIDVGIPDPIGLLLIEGETTKTKGTARKLESPLLAPGKDYPIRLRAAFAVGDRLLIEDRDVVIHAGDSIAVNFDGSRAIAAPLRREEKAR